MQTGPAFGRHQLGTRLRQLRLAQSMRLEDAAAHLEVAPSTLSRIETGQAPTKISYLHMLLDLYKVNDPEQRMDLTAIAAAGRRKDWWTDYANLLPAGTGTYLGLEGAAEHVRGFAAHTVPALLQTAGYAEAFLKAIRPELDPAEIRGLVTLQLLRQRPLDQPRRTLDLILDESVLLRSIGSPQVMADQLAHLLTFTSEPSVSVRVIRLATAQPAISPSFTLLSLPGTADSSIVCLESIRGQVGISRRAADVDAVRGIFEALATSALSRGRSIELIRSYAGSCP